MSWELFIAEPAARATLSASVAWMRNHPQNPTLFDDEYNRAVDLILLQPYSYQRGLSTKYKDARRCVLQKTSFLLLYRVDAKRKIIRIVNLLPARAQKDRA